MPDGYGVDAVFILVSIITTAKEVRSYPCRSRESALKLAERFIAACRAIAKRPRTCRGIARPRRRSPNPPRNPNPLQRPLLMARPAPSQWRREQHLRLQPGMFLLLANRFTECHSSHLRGG